MALDTATFVGGLDQTIPTDGNFVYEGDDHIRTIKLTLKNTFPALTAAIGAEPADLPKGNKAATAAPGVGDDSADGYAVGSIWVDVTGDAAYICVDASVGAAIWRSISGIAAGMEMMFFQSSTAIMAGWTFQSKDVDYVIRTGAANNVGGNTSGSPDNSGWSISGLTHAHTHNMNSHTHASGGLSTGNASSVTAITTGGPGTAATNHTHNITGSTAGPSTANTEGASTNNVSSSGAWRPPTLFGTIWKKD